MSESAFVNDRNLWRMYVSLIWRIMQFDCSRVDEYNVVAKKKKTLAVIDTDRFVDLATQVDPPRDTQ